jgi:GT2 family glycosyltransferase
VTHPAIAVIVCTCDRYAHLRECLAALDAQNIARWAYDVVVVDNSAEPTLGERFVASGGVPHGMRLVVAGRSGLSHARNWGVSVTDAPLVAFIDDDAVADADWLARLVTVFDATPNVAVAGGPVAPIWPAARPDWAGPWTDGFFSIVERGPIGRDLEPGEWLAGTNIAFRRDALLAAGGFDEKLGRHPGVLLGNEELAVVSRLRSAGHAIRYVPEARVHHRIAPDRVDRGWLRRRVAWQAISDMLSDPEQRPRLPALWDRIGRFLSDMPPESRNLVGLMRDLDDPDRVQAQGEAIAALIHLLADHGDSLERALLAA